MRGVLRVSIERVDMAADVQAAASWVAVALATAGYDADFSAASLWEVDRFFDDHAPQGRALVGGLLAEQVGQRLFALGGYVGEVIRRSLGGEWSGDDDDPEGEVNVQLRLSDGSVVWPVQQALQRFSYGSGESFAAYGAGLGLRVGARPDGPAS
jgi:hypothetical protein